MKANSRKQANFESIINKQISKIHVNKLCKLSGFYKRKPRKIEAKNFIISFLMTVWDCKHNTYSTWAAKLGILINRTVSKQAVAKRVNEELVVFLKSLLTAIMKKNLSAGKREITSDKLKIFKRILIEDSTSIHLDDRLNKDYPSVSWKGTEHATLKIQTVYELLRNQFLNFEVTSFAENDQGYAKKILEFIRPGDLILRDLGYFLLSIFTKLTSNGIYFISRLKKGVYLYLQEDDKPIDLAAMLKKRGNLDIQVFLGQTEKTPVRLIAIPVDEETASTRRMKANKEKNHGWQRKKDHLFLLGWNLLITNIPQEKMSNLEIANTYSLRWRIEIIFKAWKSCLGIKRVPPDANRIRLDAFIYCMLIFILTFQTNYINRYTKELFKQGIYNGLIKISLIKFMQFLVNNIGLILYDIYLRNHSIKTIIKRQIGYHCLYEMRHDRVNFSQNLLCLS